MPVTYSQRHEPGRTRLTWQTYFQSNNPIVSFHSDLHWIDEVFVKRTLLVSVCSCSAVSACAWPESWRSNHLHGMVAHYWHERTTMSDERCLRAGQRRALLKMQSRQLWRRWSISGQGSGWLKADRESDLNLVPHWTNGQCGTSLTYELAYQEILFYFKSAFISDRINMCLHWHRRLSAEGGKGSNLILNCETYWNGIDCRQVTLYGTLVKCSCFHWHPLTSKLLFRKLFVQF